MSSREIRFRAWDRDKNNMLDPGYLSLDGNGLQSYFNEAESVWYHNAIDIILLQYTGLKDKNGVECYWDDWVTDGINPKFLVTPDYHLLARLSEIEFKIVGNKYESD